MGKRSFNFAIGFRFQLDDKNPRDRFTLCTALVVLIFLAGSFLYDPSFLIPSGLGMIIISIVQIYDIKTASKEVDAEDGK